MARYVDKHKGFKKLIKVDEALKIIMENLDVVGYEEVFIEDACWRVLYEDLLSNRDVPPFDRAAMDGYAVRSVDVAGASENNPIRLRVVGEVRASKLYEGVVGPMEAVRIDTGAPMPEGSDAVVILEDTEFRDGYIDVFRSVSKFGNVSVRGEDVKRGELLFRRGHLLHPYDVALLKYLGYSRLKVYRKVRVSLASIGNELFEVGEDAGESGIIESNRVLITGVLSRWPVEFMRSVILPDEEDAIQKFISDSIRDSDLIVTTGGTSLGKGDVMTDYVYSIGDVFFHGVALQPSKPVLFALVGGKPFLGLPGYPVAAAISTFMFVEPAIMKLAGISGSPIYRVVRARLTRRVASKLGMLQVVRVKVRKDGDEYLATPVYGSGAGVLSSLSKGDGFLLIPENVEGYDEGALVDVHIYREVI